MNLVAKRFVAFAILIALYAVHPLVGLCGLVAGLAYVLVRRARGAEAELQVQ